MKLYTVGFIFNEDFSKVLLVKKNRPDWQKGKLNGPGGRIEDGETSIRCVAREIFEEAGLETQEEDWFFFAKLNREDASVDFYTSIYRGSLDRVSSQTDEEVGWFNTKSLPENTIHNLTWLIPMGIDRLKNNEFHCCEI